MILYFLLQLKLLNNIDSFEALHWDEINNIEIYNTRFAEIKTDSIFLEKETIDLYVFNCIFSSCIGNKRLTWDRENWNFMPPTIAAYCSNAYISKISINNCNSTSCCIICLRGEKQQINHTSINNAKHNAFTIMLNYGNPSASFCNTSNIVTTQRESAIHNGFYPSTYYTSYFNIHNNKGYAAIGSGNSNSIEQVNSHINIINSTFSATLINYFTNKHLYDNLCVVNCTAPALISSATTNIRFTNCFSNANFKANGIVTNIETTVQIFIENANIRRLSLYKSCGKSYTLINRFLLLMQTFVDIS